MARRQQESVVVEGDDDELDAQAAELARLNESEAGDLYAAIDEIRTTAGAKVMVIRLTPADDAGYCGEMPVSEFSIDRIKQLYGSGRYKVRIKGPKGFLPGGGSVNIAKGIETPKAAGGNDMHSFMELMDRRDREARESRGKLLELGIPALATVLAGLLGRQQQTTDIPALIAAMKPAPGPSVTDLVGALSSMKALSAPAPQESTIDQALKIMERVSDMGEGKSSGGGSNWIDVLRDVVKEAGPALKPVLDNLAARATPPQPIHAQVMEPEPPAQIAQPAPLMEPVPNPQPEETDAMSLFMPIIKSHLVKVYGWAAGDRDPELYAEVFFEELPRELGTYIDQTQAVEYINHPQWFEYVTQVEPRLASKKEWLEKFRKELLEIFGNIPVESTETNPEA